MGKFKDLTNQKFGKLTTIKPIGTYYLKNGTPNGIMWECKCECGNTTNVISRNLIQGITQSCGCYATEIHKKVGQQNFKKNTKSHIVEHVNIPKILNPKLNINNTSGVTGVCWDKSKQRWVAEIWFQRKRYKLGKYNDFKEAVNVRKSAEEKLHGDFLEWYNKEYKQEKMIKS